MSFPTDTVSRVFRFTGFVSATHLRAVLSLIVLAFLLFAPGQFALQPMDRDEPRFAQATKQMLETRDFVDIRFQDDARHKKPVGIYWLQSVAVSVAEAVGAADARRTIGFYRVPSFLASVVAVLLTYWAALAFLSRTGALLAAGLMAATVLLGVESRLAKTDATLLMTCLVGFGVLARLWFRAQSPETEPELKRWQIVVFWLAIGLGVLIKGPITPLVVGLPALALSLRERSMRWLAPLKPLMGLAIVLAMAAPWLVAIGLKTGGSFFADSVGKDMLAKVGQGQERHWGPPGLYAVLFWATAWPMAAFMALAFRFAWLERRDAAVAFLLAWIVPAWILFEVVQTKLPHYVLPLYPAIAVLALLALERDGVPFHWRTARWVAALVLLVPLALLLGGPVVFWSLDRTLPYFALPFLLGAALLAFLSMRSLQRSAPLSGATLAIGSAVVLVWAAYPFGLPKLDAINLSKRLAAASVNICPAPRYASAGYNEPSLVFLTNTDIDLTDGKSAGHLFATPGCAVAFVEQRFEGAFQDGLAGVEAKPALRTRITGININSGRRLDIGVYVRAQ